MNAAMRWALVPAAVVAALATVAAVVYAVEAIGVSRRSALTMVGVGLAVAAAVSVLVAGARAWRARRRARTLEQALVDAAPAASDERETELRDRMRAALRTLRRSRLGQSRGHAALYHLPWFLVIGSPAAGKTSAILQSGLDFPFEDDAGRAVAGIGGTRDCDWFFARDAIVLDTAGRYAVQVEDRVEWLAFLKLLKRARPLAPVNGIVVAASIGDIAGASGDRIVELARRLRTRVQELTETLEVVAPVYLVFTKADLIPGFGAFFSEAEDAERERVWGATLACTPTAGASVADEAATRFAREFGVLREGLREQALARLAPARAAGCAAALAFPLEVAALEPALRSFVATLFDENPFQFRPLFRGFYFTSALQSGSAAGTAGEAAARRFGLLAPRGSAAEDDPAAADEAGAAGAAVDADSKAFFVHQLFTRVLPADRDLVRQQPSAARRRALAAGYGASVLALAAVLGVWSWAWLQHRALIDATAADLLAAATVQQQRDDLDSRLQALEHLQRAIARLDAWHEQSPRVLQLAPGRAEALGASLRREYFAGVRTLMVQPVADEIEGWLADALRRGTLGAPPAVPGAMPSPMSPRAGAGAATPDAARGAAAADGAAAGYAALRAYLMLADPARRDASQLTAEVARHWRGWLQARGATTPPDELLRRAQSVAAFALARSTDPAFPAIEVKPALVESTRQALRGSLEGRPARERVYVEIVARAAARHAPVTLASLGAETDLVGAEIVSGAFTREAWEGQVASAIAEAAAGAIQRRDWVLDTASSDDLTLQGGPQALAAELTARYQAEYVEAWRRFAAALSIAPFADVDDAVERLGRLADPEGSPLRRVVSAMHRQTSWDAAATTIEHPPTALVAWAQRTFGRAGATAASPAVAAGPVAREFAPLGRLLAGDERATPLDRHLQSLAALRGRLQSWQRRNDGGAAAREWVGATLADDAASEVATASRHVDDVLATAAPPMRTALRRVLVAPLERSFAVALPVAEQDLNRLWQARVQLPFERQLASRYPFDPAARVEAGAEEIAQLFGPAGAIARFADELLSPLTLRRGDALQPRTWNEAGVRLNPELVRGLPVWTAAGDAPGGAVAASRTTAFQLLPQAAPTLAEYTLAIDGQTLRYRNGAAGWSDFVWPSTIGQPGVRITARTPDGREIVLVDAPGAFGLDRAFEVAERDRLADGSRQLTWRHEEHAVRVRLRVVRAPGSGAAVGSTALRGLRLPLRIAGADAPPPRLRATALASAGARIP